MSRRVSEDGILASSGVICEASLADIEVSEDNQVVVDNNITVASELGIASPTAVASHLQRLAQKYQFRPTIQAPDTVVHIANSERDIEITEDAIYPYSELMVRAPSSIFGSADLEVIS